MRPPDRKMDALRRLPIFGGCSNAELIQIGRLTDTASVPAGSSIVSGGDRVKHFYVVMDGRLRVEAAGGQLLTVRRGEHVGAVDILEGCIHTLSVVASTDAVMLVAGAREFSALVDEVEPFRKAVLVGLAREVRRQRSTIRIPWTAVFRPSLEPSAN